MSRFLSAVVIVSLATCGLLANPQNAQAQLLVQKEVDGPTVELKYKPFALNTNPDDRNAREELDLKYIDIVLKKNFVGEETNETSFDAFSFRFDGVRDETGERWVVPLYTEALLSEGKNVVEARGISEEDIVGASVAAVIIYTPPVPPTPTPEPTQEPTPTATATPVPVIPPLLILDEVNVVR